MKKIRVSILFRLAVLAALTATAGAVSFGYLGWLHPAFDSFAHLRIHLAAVLIAAAPALLLLRYRPEALFAAALGAVAIIGTTGFAMPGLTSVTASDRQPAADRAVYRLLQLNLLYDHPAPERVLSLIGRIRPDVITLNEVSAVWTPKLALIEAAYPYRLICPRPSSIGGVAILSRRPFADGFEPRCHDRGSLGRVRIDLSGRTVEVAALHLAWPWPYEQDWQLENLAAPLGEIGDTAILAGDFNAAPWSEAAKRVAANAGMEIQRGIGPSWLAQPLPDILRRHAGLPIDQMLVKGGVAPVSLGTIDEVGSDHLPVLLEFSLKPVEEEPIVLVHHMF